VDDDSPNSTAGGFLAGADKVVQAFHLPKNTHVTLSHTPPPAREEPKLADELEEPATSDAPAGLFASDFVMMDADSDTEAVVGLQPEQGNGQYYVPKTMQEMAEEYAARRQQLDSDADDDLDYEDLDYEVNNGEEETASPQVLLAARPARKSKKQTTVKITLPSKASTPNNLSTKAKINKKSSTTPNLKRKRRSSRKKVEEESDSADLAVTSEDQDQEDEQPSPSKRTRGRAAAAKAKRTPVAIAPSTRTLRPRTSKTTAQIEEEEQNGDD
jgi:xeroderma pigmentosum group C-complementing protein